MTGDPETAREKRLKGGGNAQATEACPQTYDALLCISAFSQGPGKNGE